MSIINLLAFASAISFAPGTHDVGLVTPKSGQTVHVAEGAVVRGVIVVSNVCDVTVAGKGIILGTGDSAIVVADSSRVKIDGVTLARPIFVRAVAASVSDVKVSNIVFRPPASDADMIARTDVPCLVDVSSEGGDDVACEDLFFSDFRFFGGPSRCYSRVAAAVGGRKIRRVSFRNMPEGMELFKAGDVETDIPAHVFGNGYRKFILSGWEMGCGISAELLAKKASDFYVSGIDGVGIRLSVTAADGSRLNKLMHDQVWTKEAFLPKVEGYRRALSLPGLRHSFMGEFLRSPTNRIDWTDSAAWDRIGKSLAVSAWFARETGMKGCIIDYEDYHRQKQFVWRPGDLEYGELSSLVRRRARDMFREVYREYPDMTIISYWLLSIDPDYFWSVSAPAMARDKGDLWPHFVNGILDAMTPGAILVDGNEEGYRFFAGRGDFNLSSVQQRDHVIELIAPENRVKFRSQVRVGFGLYVDAFENPEFDKEGKKSKWYRQPVGGSRAAAFALHATEAAYASSEYVWLWNEKRPWVDWGKPMPKILMTDMTRVRKLNGVAEILRNLVDPETYAFRRVAELKLAGRFVELLENVECKVDSPVQSGAFDFANDGSKLPKGVDLWVSRRSDLSRFGVDTGTGDGDMYSLRAESAKATFIRSVRGVRFGEHYAVSASAKGFGRMICAWKRDGVFDWTIPRRSISFKETGGEWRRGFTAVAVPQNCDELVVLMSCDLADGDSAWFDNVSVSKIFTIPEDKR